jgi:hypothetical protein
MRLTKFKITDFRSVNDSEWIEAERVTALIGVNESGKTNLLLPLWKLNPAREGEIKPTSDYPKARYGAVRANPDEFVFVTAEVEIPELVDKLIRMTGLSGELLDVVHVGRAFDGTYVVEFPKYDPAEEIEALELVAPIDAAAKEIQAMNQLAKEGSLKQQLLTALDEARRQIGDGAHEPDSIEGIIADLKRFVPESVAATSSIVPRYKLALEALEAMRARLASPDPRKRRTSSNSLWMHCLNLSIIRTTATSTQKSTSRMWWRT